MKLLALLAACAMTLIPAAAADHGSPPPPPSWLSDACSSDDLPLCGYSCDQGSPTPVLNFVLDCAAEAQPDIDETVDWAPKYASYMVGVVLCHYVYDALCDPI